MQKTKRKTTCLETDQKVKMDQGLNAEEFSLEGQKVLARKKDFRFQLQFPAVCGLQLPNTLVTRF